MTTFSPGQRFNRYEYSLKFLLVGDSDVGKDEILDIFEDEEPLTCTANTSASAAANGIPPIPKSTVILLEGKRVKLQLWDTGGQGRFGTIYRSYSRGAQGVLVVFDITNRYSFGGILRWLKEIDEQAPGLPRVLIGNRLHLEFNRAVPRADAEHLAAKYNMQYFEASPLAAFNVYESLTELSRKVLVRNGMQRLYRNSKVATLQESCCRCLIAHLPLNASVHSIDRLPLPTPILLQIRSYATSSQLSAVQTLPRKLGGRLGAALHRRHASVAVADCSPTNNTLNGNRKAHHMNGTRSPSAHTQSDNEDLEAAPDTALNCMRLRDTRALRRTSSNVLNPIRRLRNRNRLQITGAGLEGDGERDCALM